MTTVDRLRTFVLAALLPIFSAGPASAQATEPRVVWVTSHGWHTGLVVAVADLRSEAFPRLPAFDGASFLEIGWGDEGFYRATEGIDFATAARAVAWPTPTVLHLVGLEERPLIEFPRSECIEITLPPEAFAALCEFLGGTFAPGADGGETELLGPGVYGESRFYRARGSYHFPRTCNVWTLEALAVAGLEVLPALGLRAENVIHQSAAVGTERRRTTRPRWGAFLAAVGGALLLLLGSRRPIGCYRLAWFALPLSSCGLVVLTLLEVNGVSWAAEAWPAAKLLLWGSVTLVTACSLWRLREGFRWHLGVSALLGLLALAAGALPL